MNRKRTLPNEVRFPQYQNWEKATGKFLGPGTYNESYAVLKLKAQPCQQIYRPQSIGKEAGRQCYQMNGHQMVYESTFESPLVKKLNFKLNINNDSAIAAKQALRNMTQLAESQKRSQTRHNETRIGLKSNLKANNTQSFKRMSMSTNISVNCLYLNQLIQNTNYSNSKTLIPNRASQASRRNIQNYLSDADLQNFEEGAETGAMTMPIINQSYQLDHSNQKQKIFYAKTAQNFFNLARGYTKQSKSKGKRNPYSNQINDQIERSINILQAYGEYDNFKKYQVKLQDAKNRTKSQNVSSLSIVYP
ncbi:UNKNOWN [Stylonychia lemnae]|uniref:Uncharacterized protein n=1 Tax=Stylonychia lemnae TaxID=5949 RepID=A0A078A0H8_STYLE|nr:UNKNOWN [Stylonychia lemnae]|eukprot:CDW75655.1 UNKNOWN [Stylonychia lemnae]